MGHANSIIKENVMMTHKIQEDIEHVDPEATKEQHDEDTQN